MKPKSPERLIRINILVTEVHKTFLESLGSQHTSAYVRKLLDSQVSGHDTELAKLREELRDEEAQIKIKKAKIAELEISTNNEQNTTAQRGQFLRQQADELVEILQSNGGYINRIEKFIKFRVDDMNRKINGSRMQPFIVEELTQIVVNKAKSLKITIIYPKARE